MSSNKITGSGLFSSRQNKIAPEAQYKTSVPLNTTFENKCLSEQCEGSYIEENYCSRNTCFYNSTIFSLLNGYRIKKIIYKILQQYYTTLSPSLQIAFQKSITDDELKSGMSHIPKDIRSSFIMHKLFYFMCESKIDDLFEAYKLMPPYDPYNIENTNLRLKIYFDEQTRRRTLLKLMLKSNLYKNFLNIFKYSTETSWTILMFIIKQLNYTDYKVEPFSIIYEKPKFSLFPKKNKHPKVLILADSTAEDVGIHMPKLPLTEENSLPYIFKYNGQEYSYECCVTFQTYETIGRTPVFGHFEGNYICRSADPNTYDFHYGDGRIMDIWIQNIEGELHYTWAMYIRVDGEIDRPKIKNIIE